MNPNKQGSGYRNAVKSDGTVFTRDEQTGLIALTVGTFYVELGHSEGDLANAALVASHCAWSAALAATITVETSNAPAKYHGSDSGAVFCTSFEAATDGGRWIPENPSTAIVAVVGSGNSSTAATVTCGGTAIGGCMFHLGNLGARRQRHKIVVTVAGNLSINVRAKVAA